MPNDPISDRVSYRLERWRRDLIDLTLRNRLLNYRPTRATTVEVVGEVPQETLRQVLAGRKFRFVSRSDPDPAEDPIERAEHERRFQLRQDFRFDGEIDFDERHQSDRLQTRLSEAQLGKNLVAIYRRASESIEEQGVNTLFLVLGMLEWFESDDSDRSALAPLLMIPVKLTRKSAASGFELSGSDEEISLNPAVVEKLRLDFGVQLPDLPDSVEDLDLEEVFRGVQEAVAAFSRWRITSDVVLGLFSFQKFIMYRDLIQHESRLGENPVVRALCQEGEMRGAGSVLPDDVRDADLDKEMSPWSTVQVLDADSSQQRAMLAVRKGHHLVIEGPPGTGKSQTITNVIADALSQGKTVLFVSEKMAALEVVRTRLDSVAGLGDFVLELHSNKTRKTEFVRTLAQSLDTTAGGTDEGGADLARLKQLTKDLQGYVVELHRPESPLRRSPFQVIGSLLQVEEAPFVDAVIDGVLEIDGEEFLAMQERIAEVARCLADVGEIDGHPLRGLGLEYISREDARGFEVAVKACDTALNLLSERSSEVSRELGMELPTTLGDAQMVAEGARVLLRSPGAEPSVLDNPRWNAMSSSATRLLSTGRRYQARRKEVERRFRAEVLERDLSTLADHLERSVARGTWRFFSPAYWRTRGSLLSFLREDQKAPDASVLLEAVRQAQACRADRSEIEAAEEEGHELFGKRWTGTESDWDDLESFAAWVIEFRKYALKELIAAQGVRFASEGSADDSTKAKKVRDLEEAIQGARQELDRLIHAGTFAAGSDLSSALDARIESLQNRVSEIRDGTHALRTFSALVGAKKACEGGPERHFVIAALRNGTTAAELSKAFQRRFFESWMAGVIKRRPALERFRATRHEERIAAFQELDRKSFDLARARTRLALAEKRQLLPASDLSSQLQLLNREARKQRRILPIRRLLGMAGQAIQHIRPCFMMSPISVAQYLDPERLDFDLLVFDEASQIPPPDAIGAIMRARQTVVVGDSRQLPPTNFFGAQLDEAEFGEEDDLAILETMDSILDEVATSGVPSVRLKWHYRSEHQSLIRFSNEEFYSDQPLLVFPSAMERQEGLGLHLEHVFDGVYVGGGQNPVEARRVARAVIKHAQQFPELSLGVGTFGIKQQTLIQDELDQMRRADPTVEWFFHQEGEGKFFVKNLENIQGDDRDVIFLSVTYGPDANGQIRRNFGPINQDGGWKRLNVLTTRAKRHLRVFSSMLHDQIDVRNLSHGGLLLRQYLEYAATGHYPAPRIPQGEPDSPFEVAVMTALQQRGYVVVPQVGEAGYRVDLGILDPERLGRYVCGIECDGASYHSAATVRDRDRLRQQVLEARGWTIHRVWSTDWFHDRRGQTERLVQLIEESRKARATNPRMEEVPSNRPAPAEVGANPSVVDSGRRDENSRDPYAPSSSGSPDATPPSAEVFLPEPGTQSDLPRTIIPEYRFATPRRIGDPDDFYDASSEVLAEVIAEVLRVEAPMHINELSRRTGGSWGLSRAGKKIVKTTKRGVTLLAGRGQVLHEGDFVLLPGQSPAPVRSRDIDGEIFRADELPPTEVQEAIRVLLRERGPLLEDEIMSEVARLLGFRRTGSKLREIIGSALQQLVKAGEIQATSTGLTLTESR